MRIKDKHKMLALQLVGWSVILGTTLFWSVNPNNLRTFDAIMFLSHLIPLTFLYFVNHLFIIPHFLFKDRFSGFFIINTLLIVVIISVSFNVNFGTLLSELMQEEFKIRPRNRNPIFIVRDLINYVTMVGLVTAIRVVERLRQREEDLKRAESARIQSELANLRSQINPHFLLNTLNNIYSLTVIDVDKAQNAIQELSRLLRYLLYENNTELVSLHREVEFIKSYIELMRIRLNPRVRLTVDINVDGGSTTQIAPLIFISLIENAFKHGVSGTGAEESFITILFEDRLSTGEVLLSISNSNHAKSVDDKSGSGIGLEQVRKRLDLQYPNSYRWSVENNETRYHSELILSVKH